MKIAMKIIISIIDNKIKWKKIWIQVSLSSTAISESCRYLIDAARWLTWKTQAILYFKFKMRTWGCSKVFVFNFALKPHSVAAKHCYKVVFSKAQLQKWCYERVVTESTTKITYFNAIIVRFTNSKRWTTEIAFW